MKSLLRLNGYLLRYKFYLIGGLVFMLLSSLFGILPAQVVRHSFDLISQTILLYRLQAGFVAQATMWEVFTQAVLIYGAIILAMALIRGLFLFLTRQTIIVMSRKVEYDLKNDIYQHYQALPLGFYRRNNTGDLMSRISEDVSHVRMYLGPAIMYGINTIGIFVLVIGYMLSINARLTFFVLLPLPILSVSVYYVNNLINQRSTEIQKSLAAVTTFVQETFSGIRVMKAFVRETDTREKFDGVAEDYRQKSMRLIALNALFFPLIMGLISASTVLTIYVGGLEVMRGSITTGNIAEFVIYVGMLTWPVTSVGWVTSIVQRAAASQTRINEFLDVQTDIVSQKSLKTPIRGHLSFENVSFTYQDSGIEALQNLHFEVLPGQTLAIFGRTGSGKSTLANLICRMYDPTEGRILLDGHDLRDYDVQHLRSQMGYVPQEVFLFSDTIRNNIAFGLTEAQTQEEQIIEATKNADLYQNILDFPKGLDTVLGERGITLSGGQKQRTSIARAIIRSPKLLILDDCLSAVDTKTESAILNNLQGLMKNRTAIIISHRISSAKLADKIIMLDQGRIIEAGTHAELMSQNGVYREMYEQQLKGEEVEE
ncbi:MAG: ABC transporter ATP-binding protein [Bernardetiaceae bacterium]